MILPELAYSFLLVLVFTIIGTCLWQERKTKVSAVPTLPWTKRAALDLLRGHTDTRAPLKIAELGCGWGGVVLTLARLYPHAEITGYEISFCPRWVSRLRALPLGKRIVIKGEDFFSADLAAYDVVFCYLSPGHMERLENRLAALKPGSIVVSNAFAVPGWAPLESRMVNGLPRTPLYLYKIPL